HAPPPTPTNPLSLHDALPISIYRFRGAEIAVFRQERNRIAQHGKALTLSHSYRAHAHLVEGLNALLSPILGDSKTAKHPWQEPLDRKSTRLNSSHVKISYAVF